MKPLTIAGFALYPGLLAPDRQVAIVAAVRGIVRAAPLVQPVTPSGRKMSVRMTSAGDVGWVTDRAGYRYEARQPAGGAWPDIPVEILSIWHEVSGTATQPNSCLVNFYDATARMGMHQDKDEGDFSHPVVSVSLGDDALFRMGGETRGGKTHSHWLRSGDVVVMGGQARLAHHGIDRVRAGTSSLLPNAGRINLTLRVVQLPLSSG